MLCSQCHERTAVVNLHQIADGEVVLLHLCERCAAETFLRHVALHRPIEDRELGFGFACDGQFEGR